MNRLYVYRKELQLSDQNLNRILRKIAKLGERAVRILEVSASNAEEPVNKLSLELNLTPQTLSMCRTLEEEARGLRQDYPIQSEAKGEDFLRLPAVELRAHPHALRSFLEHGIYSNSELMCKSAGEIVRMDHVGFVAIKDVVTYLKERGFYLRGYNPDRTLKENVGCAISMFTTVKYKKNLKRVGIL